MRWIKLYESITEWEWHDKPEMVSLFVHLLVYANPMPNKWHGIEIPRGSLITSYRKLSEQTGIAQTTLVRCIKKLVDSEVITTEKVKAEREFTLISILKYDTYQAKKEDSGTQTERKRNSKGTQTELERNSKGTQTELLLEYKNSRIEELKNKETFLKKGGTAEKKVFEISELEKILSAENIYMTAQGYQEFKNLNESDNRYGYKGGIIRSARIFLKNPKNAIYRKNPPPAPPTVQKKDFIPDAETKKIWDKISDKMKSEIGVVDWKLWIQPLIPVAVKDKQLTIKIPSRIVYEQIESKFIQPFKKTLNENGIENLEYQL